MHKFLIFFLLPLLAACGQKKPNQKPVVAVSIAPYEYFIKQLVGDKVELVTLVPSNANPHVYEPSARLVAKLAEASIWFCIGESFEHKISKTLKITREDLSLDMPLIYEGCSCHDHDHDHQWDTHLWLSPKIALKQVEKIEQKLIELLPNEKDFIVQNGLKLKEELKNLDAELAELFKDGGTILVSHPAFAYLCKEYGLIQLNIEQDGKEPSFKQIEHLIEKAKKSHITKILIEQQHDSKGALRLANELNVKTVLVDPYASEYTANLRQMAHIIKD